MPAALGPLGESVGRLLMKAADQMSRHVEYGHALFLSRRRCALNSLLPGYLVIMHINLTTIDKYSYY